LKKINFDGKHINFTVQNFQMRSHGGCWRTLSCEYIIEELPEPVKKSFGSGLSMFWGYYFLFHASILKNFQSDYYIYQNFIDILFINTIFDE